MSWTIPKTTIKITATDVSLFFGLPILAYSEIKFGTEVLGLPHGVVFGVALSLAYFVPGFLDVYVITAMRRGGKEVGWALGLVITSVTGGSVAHLYELSSEQKVLASAAFGVVLAVVIWRVKTIAHADSPAAVAAKCAAEQVQTLTAALTQARTQIGDLTAQLGAAEQAGRDAAEQAREHERDLTEIEHRHELALTRIRAQLEVARAGTRGPANVVPLRPREDDEQDETEETRQASDSELLAVLEPMVAANPAVGRPAAITAVRQAGLACGTQRVRDLLVRAKTDRAQVATSDQVDDFDADVAVSS